MNDWLKTLPLSCRTVSVPCCTASRSISLVNCASRDRVGLIVIGCVPKSMPTLSVFGSKVKEEPLWTVWEVRF